MTNSVPQTYAINYVSTDSPENNLAFVRSLYKNILDRTGAQKEVTYLTNQLNQHTVTRDQLINNFFDSPELQKQFGLSADTVTNVYRSLLLREPDKAGLDFWTNALSSGALKASDVASSILNSTEFSKIQDNALLPTINTIWEDQASWDSITAMQLAKLIAYNPSNDGVTYPNANLNFIVSGNGPNSTATPSAQSHYYTATTTDKQTGVTTETQVSLANQIYMNSAAGQPTAADPKYLVSFIKAISDEVSTLTNGKVKWATQDPSSTGSVSYHPDTTTYDFYQQKDLSYAKYLDYSHDWAGFTIPGGATFAPTTDLPNAYKAFVDYTSYLNTALKANGLKGFSQLLYETEGSYPDMQKPVNGDTIPIPYSDVYPISSYVDPQTVFGAPYQKGVFTNVLNYVSNNPDWQASGNKNGIALAATSSPDVNMGFWGAAQAYAQVYDLFGNSDYSNNPWPGQNNIDPQSNTPNNVADYFAKFFANVSSKDLTNVKYLLNNYITPSSATGYNPASTFVFSYGPGAFNQGNESTNQPIFQYGDYILAKDAPHNLIPNPYITQSNTYTWSANDFADFASNFTTNLSSNINAINGNGFSKSSIPSIGVWGGERALDAWFGYVDLPKSKSAAWQSDVRSISTGAKVGLTQYIDNIYQSLVGRIPTTAESDALISVAANTHNPATESKMTLTSQAAILNYLINSSALDRKSLTNTEFLNHLYSNVLGRDPDDLGAQYHENLLRNGESRSTIVQNFINSKEFSAQTGYNHQTATFASYVNVLWQDNAESWITPADQQKAANQIATLMQGNPNFTLVLDFLPEFSDAVTGNEAWTAGSLTSFLQLLQKNNLTPKILYHPDGTGPDAYQWFPKDGQPHVILPTTVSYQMANWMASLNQSISKAGLPSSYLLSGILGEGSELPKDRSTYITFSEQYKNALASANLPPQAITSWATGDWHGDNTLADPSITPQLPAIMNGYFVQLYDYWPQNSLITSLPIDPVTKYPLTVPSQANSIGTALLQSLMPPVSNPLNTQLLQNPGGTIWTLNFSGSSTGSTSDAPIFGIGDGVLGVWDLAMTNQLLQSLSAEAQNLYKQNSGGSAIPQIAIWSADKALDVLVPSIPINTQSHLPLNELAL